MPATTNVAIDHATLVAFVIGRHLLAAPVESVERILRWEPVQADARLDACYAGVVPYRGLLVPVVDLRDRFSCAPGTPRTDWRIIIFAVRGEWVGGLVDAALQVTTVDAACITASPAVVCGLPGECLLGVLHEASRALLVLDMARVLTATTAFALRGEPLGCPSNAGRESAVPPAAPTLPRAGEAAA